MSKEKNDGEREEMKWILCERENERRRRERSEPDVGWIQIKYPINSLIHQGFIFLMKWIKEEKESKGIERPFILDSFEEEKGCTSDDEKWTQKKKTTEAWEREEIGFPSISY